MQPSRMRSHLNLAVLAICGLFTLFGCNFVPAEKFQATQRQLQLTEEKVQGLEARTAEHEETIRTLRAQLAELRGQDVDALEMLVVPERIEFAKLSGGYDDDGQVGDDGIVLFVQPIDKDGHVVKAAGTLKVTLLDLCNPAASKVVAERSFDAAKTRSLWYGRMWTHHFTVRCPWPEGKPPECNEITAHVVFTDLLTGRSLKAQEVFTIKLPPEKTIAPGK